MTTPTTRFLRHFVRNAAIVAAITAVLFLGLAATGLAMALAFLWGGPFAALAVYFVAFVALISVLTYRAE